MIVILKKLMFLFQDQTNSPRIVVVPDKSNKAYFLASKLMQRMQGLMLQNYFWCIILRRKVSIFLKSPFCVPIRIPGKNANEEA